MTTTDDTEETNRRTNTQTAQKTTDSAATERRTDGSTRGRSGGVTQGETSPADMLRELRIDQQIVLAGAVIAAIGSVLPWASVFGFSIGGLSGNGKLTLVLAIVAGAITVFEPEAVEEWASAIVAGCGGLVVLIGVLFYLDYGSIAAIGLYVTIIGGVVIALPQTRRAYRRYQEDTAMAR